MSVRILIADDDIVIRSLLRKILEEIPDWQVCGEAANGVEAVAQTAQLAPDIVILDLAMPKMNGLEAGKRICAAHPFLPMILVTVQEISPELSQAARNAGFQGAVSKATGREVVSGIEALLHAKNFFNFSASDVSC